jgi:predicted glycoside hydrolase/deacetylase ChbG (UPF0249 family)
MNIIINADDFGGSEELNLCVQKLHELGVLSSATLFANSPYFDNAIKIAKDLPELGIGVHLTLDGPHNVLNNPSSIINPSTLQFYDQHQVVKKLKYFGFYSKDIYKEYKAQIQKIMDHGIKITHIDHHHHLHLYFQSLIQVIRVAQKFKIGGVRSQIMLMPYHTEFYNVMYRKFNQYYIRHSHINTPEGHLALLQCTENPRLFNLRRIKKLLSGNLKTFEIVTHPKSINYFDTTFLTDPEFIKLIGNHNLINYSAYKKMHI